jgi:hypothetical protein
VPKLFTDVKDIALEARPTVVGGLALSALVWVFQLFLAHMKDTGKALSEAQLVLLAVPPWIVLLVVFVVALFLNFANRVQTRHTHGTAESYADGRERRTRNHAFALQQTAREAEDARNVIAKLMDDRDRLTRELDVCQQQRDAAQVQRDDAKAQLKEIDDERNLLHKQIEVLRNLADTEATSARQQVNSLRLQQLGQCDALRLAAVAAKDEAEAKLALSRYSFAQQVVVFAGKLELLIRDSEQGRTPAAAWVHANERFADELAPESQAIKEELRKCVDERNIRLRMLLATMPTGIDNLRKTASYMRALASAVPEGWPAALF